MARMTTPATPVTPSALADLRKSYERAELNESASHAQPLQQFQQWLDEAISALLTEAMTRRTYIMSIMAMVFLPATFLTGLFGVNLGGIPGGNSAIGFLVFVSILASLITGLAIWLRLHRWL